MFRLVSVSAVILATVGCNTDGAVIAPSIGGTANTFGGNGNGGTTVQQQGGTNAQGGVANNGGTTANSGGSPVGGVTGNMGGKATGGTTTAQGGKATGGTTTAQGGNSNGGAGGVLATGGTTSKGGSSSGGAGGNMTTGGSATGGTAVGGNATGGTATAGGTAGVGGTSSAGNSGFIPVPSSANTTNFDPAAWYAGWKTKFYVDCGSGQARIAAGAGSAQTFSEGIGYGMLLAAANDDRDALDKLWAYYQGHLDPNGLMNWQINGCTAEAWGNYAATDGDEDVAMALVQADAKWGGYTTAAKGLIAKIKQFETSQTTTPTYLRPGDATNNGGKGESVVNPSYFAPGYWRVWATYTGDASWNQLVTDAYAMLAKWQALTISNYTNLVPDWGKSDGTNPNGGGYYYDACRTPWRVATDYVWFGTPEAKTFLTNISTFVDARGGIASTPFDKNSAFLGAFALSGMAVSQAKADTYLNAWLSTQMDDAPYFQGSLRGLYLLVANNKFAKGM